MKKNYVLGLLCFLVASVALQAQENPYFQSPSKISLKDWEKCGTESYMEGLLKDPNFAEEFFKNQAEIKKKVSNYKSAPCVNPLIIPVAVHYNTPVTLANQQCLIDAAIAQVDQLNLDFSSCNSNVSDICAFAESCPDYFAVDALDLLPEDGSCIQFCLGDQNLPAGEDNIGGLAITHGDYDWPNVPGTTWDGYMNLFVSNSQGGGILGIAPLNGASNPNGNGVYILASAFGSQTFGGCTSGTGIGNGAPYNGGATGTHEIGHYFGLEHSFSDTYTDTPPQNQPNYGCPVYDAANCTASGDGSNNDFSGNFMDYVDDDCMSNFSAQQVATMNAVAAAQSQWATNEVSCYADWQDGTNTYASCQGPCSFIVACPTTVTVAAAETADYCTASTDFAFPDPTTLVTLDDDSDASYSWSTGGYLSAGGVAVTAPTVLTTAGCTVETETYYINVDCISTPLAATLDAGTVVVTVYPAPPTDISTLVVVAGEGTCAEPTVTPIAGCEDYITVVADAANPAFPVAAGDNGTASYTVTFTPNAAGPDCCDPGMDAIIIDAATNDGSLEALGAGGASPWSSTSTNFGTVMCDTGGCGTGGGTINYGIAPNDGAYLGWFGGIGALETGTLEGSFVIPACTNGTSTLTFAYENSSCGSAADFMELQVDGVVEWSDDADPATCDAAGTIQTITVDLSAYADGASHTILFTSTSGNDGVASNFTIDNISLVNIGCSTGATCDVVVTGAYNCTATGVGYCNNICFAEFNPAPGADDFVDIALCVTALGCADAPDASCLTTTACTGTCETGDEVTITETGEVCTACGADTTPGCTDAAACNFDAAACVDDGSCLPTPVCNTDICAGDTEVVDPADACVCIVDVVQVLGCTDPTACNFDVAANCDDGSCLPAPVCNTDICAGDTEIVDPADACVCIVDVVQVLGCTDPTACNFDVAANCDDGSCLPAPVCNTDICAGDTEIVDPADACVCIVNEIQMLGCTNPAAGNFDPAANCDDGTCDCIPDGCIDPLACNFDPTATCDDGSCLPAPVCNTDICAGDTEIVDPADACVCIVNEIQMLGCTDVTATNYDPTANCENGSCTFTTVCTGTIILDDVETCNLDDGTGVVAVDIPVSSCNADAPVQNADGTWTVIGFDIYQDDGAGTLTYLGSLFEDGTGSACPATVGINFPLVTGCDPASFLFQVVTAINTVVDPANPFADPADTFIDDPECVSSSVSVTIYPVLTATDVSDAVCGDRQIDLISEDGTVCDSQTQACAADGDTFDADFSATFADPAGCSILTATSVACNTCASCADGSITGVITVDDDCDGLGGDVPTTPLTVELYDGSGTLVATVTTDATGTYLFDPVSCGTYDVLVDEANLPPCTQGANPNPRAGVTVTDGAAVTAEDFSFEPVVAPACSGTVDFDDATACSVGVDAIPVTSVDLGCNVIPEVINADGTLTVVSFDIYQIDPTGVNAPSYLGSLYESAALGAEACGDLTITYPPNLTCDPQVYTFASVTAINTISADLTAIVDFVDDLECTPDTFSVTIYPSLTAVDVSAGCSDLQVNLVAEDGTVCDSLTQVCMAAGDILDADFTGTAYDFGQGCGVLTATSAACSSDPVFVECVDIARACESNSIYVIAPGADTSVDFPTPLAPGADWIFEWYLEGVLVGTNVGQPYFSPSTTGNYTVIITDPTTCQYWDSSAPCTGYDVNEIIDCTDCDND